VGSGGRIRPSEIHLGRERTNEPATYLRFAARTEGIVRARQFDFVGARGIEVGITSEVIPFVKASACGNDFLLVDSRIIEHAVARADMAALTRRMCDRHEGVGADGVEWMYPHASADVEIRLINADGSPAEISGNGTRCVAAYVYAEQGREKISIQTGAGLKTCLLTGRSEGEYEFEIQMGEAAVGLELAVTLDAGEVRGIPVLMGNPHYVVFVNEFVADWQARAAKIQSSSQFKHGVNVELVIPDGTHDMRVLFFERGVGETQSSGTGSCAAAVAAIATGRAESPVRVHAPGGIQTIRQEGKLVFLRGMAQLVFRGEFFLD
jgi:diaminopimelate epimerase